MTPSVTQVLSPHFDSSWIKQEGVERGQRVHAAIAEQLRGGFPLLEPQDLPYLESFDLWSAKCLAKAVCIEEEFIDYLNCFIGHPDLVCRLNYASGIWIVDYKTYPGDNMAHRHWDVQLSAYEHLAEVSGKFSPEEVMGSFTLILNKEGKTPKTRYTENQPEAYTIFYSCLNAWRWFHVWSEKRRRK